MILQEIDYLSLASRISDVGSVFQVWNAEADTGANTQFILGDSSNYNYHAGTEIITYFLVMLHLVFITVQIILTQFLIILGMFIDP